MISDIFRFILRGCESEDCLQRAQTVEAVFLRGDAMKDEQQHAFYFEEGKNELKGEDEKEVTCPRITFIFKSSFLPLLTPITAPCLVCALVIYQVKDFLSFHNNNHCFLNSVICSPLVLIQD